MASNPTAMVSNLRAVAYLVCTCIYIYEVLNILSSFDLRVFVIFILNMFVLDILNSIL